MGKIKILIDAGHGGEDRYNRGPSGYIEADGVLKISKFLKEILEATGHFEVFLTRDKDATMSLTSRGKMAGEKMVVLFISEHTDAGPSGAGGTTVYYSVDIPGDKPFAEAMARYVSEALGIRNRGAKTRPGTKDASEDYYTVIDTAQDVGTPHVLLIESAFHSNPQEEALLKQDTYLRKIAEAQAKAIMEFFKISNNEGEYVMALKKGDKGESVRQLQINLNLLGANLVVDGSFGPATEKAVREFQAKHGLEVDGIAGPITQAKIKELLAPKSESAPAPAPAPADNFEKLYSDLRVEYEKAMRDNDGLKQALYVALEERDTAEAGLTEIKGAIKTLMSAYQN